MPSSVTISCEHPRCTQDGAEPQFTKSMKHTLKGERQPRYFCRKHRSKHPDVGFVSGQPRERR